MSFQLKYYTIEKLIKYMEKIKNYLPKLRNIYKVIFINYAKVTKILWQNDKKSLILMYIRNVINGISPIIIAFIYGDIINLVILAITKKENINTPIFYLFIIWFFIYLSSNYINTLNYVIYQKFNLLLEKLYTSLFFGKLNSVNIKTLYNKDFQDSLNKAEQKYSFAAYQFSHAISNFNSAILSFIFSIIAFAYFSPIIALIVLISVIPTFIVELNISRMAWSIWDESTEFREKYFSTLNVFRANSSEEIKIHNNGGYLIKKINILLQDRYDKEIKLIKNRTQFNLIGSLIDTFVYILSSGYIVFKAIKGQIPPGSIVSFFSILSNYISSVSFLSDSVLTMYDAGLYLNDINDFLDFEIKDNIQDGKIILDRRKNHKIEFRNVYFKYPNAHRYVFKDLSLIIEPKAKIAIIGENGSGKTTFINLLSRFYDVTSGEILIDDINIKEYKILSIYENLGILFQDFMKYEFSIEENIRLGKIDKLDPNKKEIIEAAKQSQSHIFIQKLKDKYDTNINIKGQTLSGGQWQKLAIAREFFRDPPILILDEPTSSLDAKAENEVFENIERISENKTVILISHRFSTVRNADKIFVFEKGKILEEGSHKDLIKKKGKYSELFELQAQGYK